MYASWSLKASPSFVHHVNTINRRVRFDVCVPKSVANVSPHTWQVMNLFLSTITRTARSGSGGVCAPSWRNTERNTCTQIAKPEDLLASGSINGSWRANHRHVGAALDQGRCSAKITDFGLSMRLGDGRSHVSNIHQGQPPYQWPSQKICVGLCVCVFQHREWCIQAPCRKQISWKEVKMCVYVRAVCYNIETDVGISAPAPKALLLTWAKT